MRRNAVLRIGLAAVLVAAGAGWVGARRIHSPADVAAKTAPPEPSVIVAPVEQRALTSEVVVRGTVRYGAPQAVALAASALKKAADIVTAAPTKGAEIREGQVALAASARPVFVLGGDKPAYRDIGPGATGSDVEQLERALGRLGFDPGPLDGTYDAQTAAAVTAMYASAGWAAFGSTDEQTQALRTAQADNFTAQSDLLSQREALQSAKSTLASAEERVQRGSAARTAAVAADAAALAKAEHERLLAVADVAARSAALDTATDNEAVAKLAVEDAVAGVPTVPTRVELATLQAALKQATRAVATATADLAAARAGLAAVVTPAADAATKDATVEVSLATREVSRAKEALEIAQGKLDLYEHRPATATVDAVTSKLGVQVPADEVLFFPSLPLRVDSVKVAAGELIAGPVMTVTNSRLAIDGALSLDDTRLVKVGAPVSITESELGIKAVGTVTAVAAVPGTDGVEAQRFHLEVTPTEAPASLVGTSVVLSVKVSSTQGDALVVPVSALAVAANGTTRVQVQAVDKSTSYITVTAGLSAGGFVAVTATTGGLKAGDLVVVGADSGTVRLASKTAAGGVGASGGTDVPASRSTVQTSTTGG